MAVIRIRKVSSTCASARLAALLYEEYGLEVDHIVATKSWEGPAWVAYGVYKSGRSGQIMSEDDMPYCLEHGVDLIEYDLVRAKDEQWKKSLDSGLYPYRGQTAS